MTAQDPKDPIAATTPWRGRLPWVLFGVTLAALALVLAQTFVLARRTAPPAELQSVSTRPPQPTISTVISDGIGLGTDVWRDGTGRVVGVQVAVRPYEHEEVWCRLVADGKTVEVHASDGIPAICTWVQDAELTWDQPID